MNFCCEQTCCSFEDADLGKNFGLEPFGCRYQQFEPIRQKLETRRDQNPKTSKSKEVRSVGRGILGLNLILSY
jgi:hypothetical protein